MAKTQETVLEINLNHLEHNYRYLSSKIKSSTKFLAVLKAFAYGSDAIKIAEKLEALGVDYLAVAYTKEGVALRKSGIKIPILVLHPQAINFNLLLKHQLTPTIYSQKILDSFIKSAQNSGQTAYPIHIKFNTGLNRLGFAEKEIEVVSDQILQTTAIKVTGVFSHLAASEDLNEKHFTQAQLRSFENITQKFCHNLGYTPIRHLLNTSGITNFSEAQYDMVRSGIGLYGFGNEAHVDQLLKPVATLKTIISQIHTIKPNETVGYNRAFAAKTFKTIATLPIGHADGIGRIYGKGKTWVYVNGKKAFIIGNVCMDMIMIDITNIPCNEGDEVIIFGENPNASEFSASANTISYELLTGISQRVKRVFTKN